MSTPNGPDPSAADSSGIVRADSGPTAGVLLAAGSGSRLGLGPKALLPFRGRTLVEVLADVLRQGGCHQVVVVLGAEASRVLATVDLDRHKVVVNPDWQSGMGSSFRLGVDSVAPLDHVLVALVDQPGLTSDSVARLISAHRPGRVTAAGYGEPGGALIRRHPLLLDASLKEAAARSASGDAGARLFLKANPGLIDLVDCSDQSGGEDLDTPDQLDLLR